MTTTWRQIASSLVNGFLGENMGERFILYLGLLQDEVAQATVEAGEVAWLLEPNSPDDVLPLVGSERNMERYPVETASGYRARLHDAWDSWTFAGNPSVLNSQIQLFGYPNAIVKERQDWPSKQPTHYPLTFDHPLALFDTDAVLFDDGYPYWSIFWLRVPLSDHDVDGPLHFDDGSVFNGADTCFDMSGPGQGVMVRSACRLLNKWRPAHVIAGSIIFAGSAPLFDNGELFDSGVLFDGILTPETFDGGALFDDGTKFDGAWPRVEVAC